MISQIEGFSLIAWPLLTVLFYRRRLRQSPNLTALKRAGWLILSFLAATGIVLLLGGLLVRLFPSLHEIDF